MEKKDSKKCECCKMTYQSNGDGFCPYCDAPDNDCYWFKPASKPDPKKNSRGALAWLFGGGQHE
jgi:hypothetical protein